MEISKKVVTEIVDILKGVFKGIGAGLIVLGMVGEPMWSIWKNDKHLSTTGVTLGWGAENHSEMIFMLSWLIACITMGICAQKTLF